MVDVHLSNTTETEKLLREHAHVEFLALSQKHSVCLSACLPVFSANAKYLKRFEKKTMKMRLLNCITLLLGLRDIISKVLDVFTDVLVKSEG